MIHDVAATWDAPLRVAMDLAQRAGEAIERIRREGFVEGVKSDASPVTRADLESDRIIREGLQAAFPDDGVLTEESGAFAGSRSGRTWIVDPLDGTEGFVQGSGDYAVHVALVDGDRPVLGVVYEPDTQRLYHAIAGVGAFLAAGGGGTIRQLKVSRRDAPAEMPLVTSSRIAEPARQRLVTTLGVADGGQVRSVGFKIGKIVRREADVYYSVHPVHYWDSCAPLVVLEAAGGHMTLLDGRPLTFDVACPGYEHEGPFVASNGTRHEALCHALRGVTP